MGARTPVSARASLAASSSASGSGPSCASGAAAASERAGSTQPKRRASTKRSSSPPASAQRHVRVRRARARRRLDVQPPGHAQVHDDAGVRRRVPVDLDEQVLAHPAHAGDDMPDRQRAQTAQVDGAAEVQRLAAPPHRLDATPFQQRAQPAHDGLDLGQLGHRSPGNYLASRWSASASASRAKSATDSCSARCVPAMPLAASAAPATASPNAAPSARRNIFRRVANACLTTSSNNADVAHGRQRRGPRQQAEHRRRHGGRGMERPRAHVEQHPRLGVLRDRDGQPPVGPAPGRRHQPLRHLALDHHHRARDVAARARLDQRQDQRARDLVGQVADHDHRPPRRAPRRRVVERQRVGVHAPRRAPRPASSAASTRCMSGSRSTARTRRGGGDAPASAAVSVPSPAPISTTTSSAPAAAAATMRASTLRSWRKFCPHDFFAARPWRASTRRGSSTRSPFASRRSQSGRPGSTVRSSPARTPRW